MKSLHGSLEAQLASMKDPETSDSDVGEENEKEQPEGISARRSVKVAKRKGRRNSDDHPSNIDDDTSNQTSTVVYVGHLPAGFEEREITVFLNQFGNVKRCRVSRSTKTGRSRGYAFVEFADAEVAQIVAKTMSGYFLMEKRLVCHVLPNDKVHELMFAKPKRVQSKADRQKKARDEVNTHRSADVLKRITAKLVKREEMKRKKLATLGIDYDFPGCGGVALPGNEAKNESARKKKRRKSYEEEEEDKKDEKNTKEAKTPKSQRKRKKKSKKISSVGQIVEEKENNATTDGMDDITANSSKTKEKPRAKANKKAKAPKNK